MTHISFRDADRYRGEEAVGVLVIRVERHDVRASDLPHFFNCGCERRGEYRLPWLFLVCPGRTLARVSTSRRRIPVAVIHRLSAPTRSSVRDSIFSMRSLSVSKPTSVT